MHGAIYAKLLKLIAEDVPNSEARYEYVTKFC
jgi:hypothetical protein